MTLEISEIIRRLRETKTERTYDSVGRAYDYPKDLPILAADALQQLSERTDVAGWCGYHSEKGFDRNTFALTRQEAVSRLMMTGIAGDHGWKVEPLYRHHVSGAEEI